MRSSLLGRLSSVIVVVMALVALLGNKSALAGNAFDYLDVAV